MIDLHVHTTMSDGTLTPEEVVGLALETGLSAIAITDHDTVSGVATAQQRSKGTGVLIIPGVEISTQWDHGILHCLGYFVDTDHPQLLRVLRYLVRARIDRVPQIVAKLQAQDVGISLEDVRSEVKEGVPGRPHVANALMRKGVVRNIQEAFDRFLKKGAPAYVEKVKLSPADAIGAISAAGGVPVLAHPYSLKPDDPEILAHTLHDLVDLGMQGIEVYYPEHTREQTSLYLDLAARFNLAVTGGTDFHGANKPAARLGFIPEQEPLPYSLVEELALRKGKRAPGENLLR
jgi:predicted metal-dependent phosphoesterase TrpH